MMNSDTTNANPFSLDGEVALITGGGTGLGFAMAQCFIQAGAKAVIVGRRAHVIEEAVEKLGPSASGFAFDISDVDRAEELVDRAECEAGSPVSILVNNAAYHLKKLAIDTSSEEFEGVLKTQLFASHALSRAVLPGMLERKHGNILFMASMTSYLGVPKSVAYAAAKSAFIGMIRTLAVETAEGGVRVNGIAPGWIRSPMMEQAMAGDEARQNKVLSRTPMNKFGEPEYVGQTAVFLCSPAAQFITGTVLPVDGGASIGF